MKYPTLFPRLDSIKSNKANCFFDDVFIALIFFVIHFDLILFIKFVEY